MPHMVIEYTPLEKGHITDEDLMMAVHWAAVSTGIFEESAIKVRVKQYQSAFVGGRPDQFVHVTIYLIDGRDEEAKKRLTQTVHDRLASMFADYASVSVDARDLDRDVYTKSVPRGH